jgi:hypothetical protein
MLDGQREVIQTIPRHNLHEVNLRAVLDEEFPSLSI